MIVQPIFVMCYLRRRTPADDPQQGAQQGMELRKGTSGGETPLQACLRSVEETGFTIADLFSTAAHLGRFRDPAGRLTSSSPAPDGLEPVSNGEGDLDWKSVPWVLSADEVVDNLHLVTPHVLAHEPAMQYHFIYQDMQMCGSQFSPLPDWVDIHRPLT